jgi:PAS domain S-box-containing protein
MDATARDTSIRTTDEMLREHEIIYQTMFEASTDAIFMESLDGHVLDCNSANIQYINHVMGGLSPEAVVGVSVLEFSAPEYRPLAKAVINHVFQNGQIVNYTSMYQMGPNEPRWYETNIGPFHDGAGNVVAAMLVSRDITGGADLRGGGCVGCVDLRPALPARLSAGCSSLVN